MSNTTIDMLSALVDDISDGKLDGSLDTIFNAVNLRRSVIRSTTTIDDFLVGDRVVINERCGTKYLIGEWGTVVGIRRTKVTIQFDNPKGRFARKRADGTPYSSDVVVPIEILDKKK